ncbi:hypothetical protein RB195_012515 [Necator americanus]|uniref:Reverse transcriptase domain-containing protein n=1 Tax=Necator americanus TaxID=51031 RepID=A0ABR1D7I0_NECAM
MTPINELMLQFEHQLGIQHRSRTVTGVRQRAVAGPFLFNFVIDYIMRRTVDQSPVDIVLAPAYGVLLRPDKMRADLDLFETSNWN